MSIEPSSMANASTAPEKATVMLKRILQGWLSQSREHQVAFFYTGASVLDSFCIMLAGFFLVRWVPPADVGLWQSVRLAVTYSMFVLAGVNNGLSRDLPYYLGKSDERTVKGIAGTALYYLRGACLLVLLVGIGGLLLFHNCELKLLGAIATVTASIIFTFYTNYLIVTFRSAKSFRNLTKIKITDGACALATIPLFYYSGYAGMLLRVFILALVAASLMHFWRPLKVSPSWDSKSFVLLLKTGVPIFVVDYICTSAATTDRLVLLKLGGVETVGYYALALMAREAVGMIPGALGEYVYPRMSYSFGQHHDRIRLWRMSVKASILAVAFMTPAVITGWFLLPPVVTRLFPKYTEAIGTAQLLLIAVLLSGSVQGGSAILSMKAWKLLIWYRVSGAALSVVGPIAGGLYFKAPLFGVGLGYLAGQLLWCPLAWGLVYFATHRDVSDKSQGLAIGTF